MGSYGAFSIALNNPTMFSGVAGIAGPLAFWGTMPLDPTYQGVREQALLDTMLAETNYDSVLDATDGAGDAASFQALMKPSPERRITSFMIAMSAAFSPTNPAAPVLNSLAAYGVDLPLGIDGKIHEPTWTRWIAYNVLARYMANPIGNLAGVHIFLDAGEMDDLGLFGAHLVLAGALSATGKTPSYMEVYPSNSDAEGGIIKADHTTHTFERIKKMLVWASDKF